MHNPYIPDVYKRNNYQEVEIKKNSFFNITNEIKKKTEKESFEPLQCSFLDLKI